ncbi:MAG: tetratricopeptide repeat protein [Flavobacteriaceae bacterium]|nr:tetratricopeptide repeat protein [Flavobacteriaceae bacterium]
MISRTNIFSILFLFCFWSIFAQNKEIDSLKQVLETSKNDIEKSQVLNQISDLYKTQNPTLMFDFANQALELSQKIKNRQEEATAYLNLGNSQIISGNYPKALEYFTNAKNTFEELESAPENKQKVQDGLARAYGSIGIVFSEQSNYSKALEYHLKALNLYEKSDDKVRLARVYNNVGIVYKSRNEQFKALEYFLKAQEIQEEINDRTIGITTTNIGNIYFDQKNYPKAIEFYNKASIYFQKYPNPRGEGELYNNLGLYYQVTSEPQKAIESWEKAKDKFNAIEDKFGISDTYFNLGAFYFEQNNLDKALENTQKAKELAKEIKTLEMLVLSENLLSRIYEKKGDLNKSLEHFRAFSVAKDSLTNYENIRKSVQSEMNIEFEKRETLHKKEQEQKEVLIQEQSKRHTLQLVFGGLFLVLCVGLGFLFYNRNQLKKNLTLQKNLAEYEQKALHLQMNPHFVFNCLGSISSFIVQNGNDSAIKYLAKFSKLMRLTLEYSKESLIPVDKEIEGLQNYLELEQLRFNKVFDFKITKDATIEDDMALPPLLIQPFVENAIIHGLIPKKEFGLVLVDFSLTDKNLICTITDNGIGFSKSKEIKENSVQVHKSMALDIIKKRLEMMGDSTSKSTTFTIEEIKENGEIKGTKVVLRLPIQYLE